jgi:hypothetical protein
MSYHNYVPVNSDINGPNQRMTTEQIIQPGIVYKDAYNGNILKSPPQYGDKSDFQGIKYHVGEYVNCQRIGKIIAFHHRKLKYTFFMKTRII